MGDLTLALAVAGAGAAALLAAPFLAALTISVPNRDIRAWWQVRPLGGARWAATAAIAVVFAALAGAAAGWTGAWPAYLALALAGTVLSIVDVEHHRLPDRMIGSAAVAAVTVFLLVAACEDHWSALGRGVAAAALVLVVLSAVVLISPRGVGFGDAKLGALVAGCLGWRSWSAVADGLALGILAAGRAAVALLAARRTDRATHIPLGPFLLAGALVITALPQ